MRSRWVSGMVIVLVFAAGVAVGALQQAASGSRREPQFENEHVKVWKSIIMPNQPLTLHRHEGQQHGDINRGSQPIEVIVVEMRK